MLRPLVILSIDPMKLLNRLSLFALLCTVSVSTWAHAILQKAVPAVNQVVSGTSTPVELRFNSRIDGKRSKLTLVAPDGHEQVLNIAEQSSPDTLASQATGLMPGAYVLRWQVLAQDGHITRGEVSFKVH